MIILICHDNSETILLQSAVVELVGKSAILSGVAIFCNDKL